MKILIYTHEFPPFAGGAGIYSYDLATGLVSLGAEVHIATPLIEKKEDLEFPVPKNMYTHYMHKWQSNPPWTYFFLLHLHLEYAFDIVVITERRAQEIIATLNYPWFRYLAVLHGTEILDYFGNKDKKLNITPKKMAKFYEQAEICIAGSYATLYLAKKLLNTNNLNLVKVYYGININRFGKPNPEDVRNLRQIYGNQTEIIFSLGRLDLDKGHDVLISAFKKIHESRPNSRLLIGGDGPLKPSLMQLCESLNLNNYVRFLGKIPQSKISNYFSICDVFALPSKSENRWEGFGLVYLEANYYEKPTVGGNEGGVPEAIADKESGFIVNSRDEDAVAFAITTLLDSKVLRDEMGIKGKKRVLEYFNSQRMASETFEYIKIKTSNFKLFGKVLYSLNLILWIIIYIFFLVGRRLKQLTKI